MTLNDAILGEQPVMEEMSPAVHFGDREREREVALGDVPGKVAVDVGGVGEEAVPHLLADLEHEVVALVRLRFRIQTVSMA
jgi:hypothetical protein